jgi:hypothetical protein
MLGMQRRIDEQTAAVKVEAPAAAIPKKTIIQLLDIDKSYTTGGRVLNIFNGFS